MPTLKERVENNPGVFFLAALVAGFAAGFGAFPTILNVSGRTYVSADRLQKLESTAPQQRWLRIRGVDAPANVRGRIVARIDGIAVSYPSRVVFAEFDRSMRPEDFVLPAEKDEYMVSFELLALGEDGSFQKFTSQEVVRVRPPFDGEYKLLPVTESKWTGSSRGGARSAPTARISFEIR